MFFVDERRDAGHVPWFFIPSAIHVPERAAEGRVDLVGRRRSARGVPQGHSREDSRGARRCRAAAPRGSAQAMIQRAPRTPEQLAAELAAPDVLAGPHGEAVRRAAADRAMMLDIVERAAAGRARDDSRHRPHGRRAGAARGLGRDDAPSSRRRRLRRVARQPRRADRRLGHRAGDRRARATAVAAAAAAQRRCTSCSSGADRWRISWRAPG